MQKGPGKQEEAREAGKRVLCAGLYVPHSPLLPLSLLADFFRNDSWGPTRNQSQFPAWWVDIAHKEMYA